MKRLIQFHCYGGLFGEWIDVFCACGHIVLDMSPEEYYKVTDELLGVQCRDCEEALVDAA